MAIQIRRGTDAQWESNKTNIVAGEPAVTLDTGRFFVGTGSGTYEEYINVNSIEDSLTSTATNKVLSANMGKTLNDDIDLVKDEIAYIQPQIYSAAGYIVSGNNGLAGYGTVIVCLTGDRVRLDFAFNATQGGSGGFVWGINSYRLATLNPNIPSNITPLGSPCGTCTYYRGGMVYGNLTGFGGTVNAVSGYPQLWGFGRMYDPSGLNGLWPEDAIPGDTYIVGTAYGKIE